MLNVTHKKSNSYKMYEFREYFFFFLFVCLNTYSCLHIVAAAAAGAAFIVAIQS